MNFFAASLKKSQIWLFLLIITAFTGLVLGFQVRQLLKLLAMILCSQIFFNNWPNKENPIFRLFTYTWVIAFSLHLSILGFLIQSYGDIPDELMLFQALSNTNIKESAEFLGQNLPLLLKTIISTLTFMSCWLWACWWFNHNFKPLSQWVILLTTIVFIAMHLNPTIRLQNPFFYWNKKIHSFVKQQKTADETVNALTEAAKLLPEWQAKYTGTNQNTVILVIGESLNRENMQIYGYSRKTTPQLERIKNELMIFSDVLSGAASTQPAVDRMLTTHTTAQPTSEIREPDVLMLAKSVGYKVYWLTNQKDNFIRANFASQADVLVEKNIATGRSSASLDEVLIPAWQQALDDTAPKKLIVIHMMGQHPHYDLRYPSQFNLFKSDDDVDALLKQKGISLWNRTQRNYYDNSIAYTDSLVGQLIDDVKVRQKQARILFVSDHGQEVGHSKDFSGHSPNTIAGYSIPLWVWQSSNDSFKLSFDSLDKPIQTDTLDWGLLHFLQIQTPKTQPTQDIFSPLFRPMPHNIGGRAI